LVLLGAGLLSRITNHAGVPPKKPASVPVEVRAIEGQPVIETVDLRNGNLHVEIPIRAALIGGALFGPPGAVIGGTIGSSVGVGATFSWVPSTNSWYVGPTIVAGIKPGAGSGFGVNAVLVPSNQNPNSIANHLSFSGTWQPMLTGGSTVTKSPGSGPPVAGYSTGTRLPASGSASFTICIKNCGC
jgi:hypothetical protein